MDLNPHVQIAGLERYIGSVPRATQLLTVVRANIAASIQTWARFIGPEGDIKYLLDMDQYKTRKWLDKVPKSVQMLSDIEQRSAMLNSTIDALEREVSLRMCSILAE